jgi:hypothetical protein
MDRYALFEQALPACRECGAPVQRVEHSWHVDEDGVWRLRCFMVCANRHRVVVEPLVA